MDKILILVAVVGVLGYSWQQSKKYLSPTSSFNAIITFDPEHYTDIRWFEVFRKLTHGVPSAYEEFVSIRNRFKNFAVILYI